MNLDRAWTVSVASFLVVLMLIGGTSYPVRAIALIEQIGGLALMVFGILRLRLGLPSRAAVHGLAILALGLALVGLQLVPLPQGLWTALPGRQFVVDSLAAAAAPAGWMPLSLSPPATRGVLLALLPGIALFIAALTLNSEARGFFAMGLVLLMIFNVLLGLGQKFQGPGGSLYLFHDAGFGWSSGTFANRNFYAASLYVAIPVAAALGIAWTRGQSVNRFVVAFFAVTVLILLLIGLAAAASRAGIVLAMAGVLASGALAWGRSGDAKAYSVSRLMMLALSGAIFLIAQFGLVGLLRLAATDPVNDYRASIFEVSSKVFSAFFPFGSGFGTFVPVYAMFETPITMLDNFVNHAHNDWLELAIEGGAPMIVLLLVFLLWYGANTIRLWRQGGDGLEDLFQRAAAISVGLLLLHSIVDYPLRTPALMGLFALFCGIMACTPAPLVKRIRRRVAPAPSAAPAPSPQAPAPERRKGPYFVRKDGPTLT